MIIYSPYIGDTIPAFTQDKIIIPFTQNPAVSMDEVGEFILKIQDYVQTNSSSPVYLISDLIHFDKGTGQGIVEFLLENQTEWKPTASQYYKFQLAYLEGYVKRNSKNIYNFTDVSVFERDSLNIVTLNNNQNNTVDVECAKTFEEGYWGVSANIVTKDLLNQPYTFSWNEQIQLVLAYKNNGSEMDTFDYSNPGVERITSFTLPIDRGYERYQFISFYKSYIKGKSTIKLQLEAGNSATAWEEPNGVHIYPEGNPNPQFSSVSIGRCIDKPEHIIVDLESESINRNFGHYTAQYTTVNHSEPIYSYSFQVRGDSNVIEDTGEILYNTENDYITQDNRMSNLYFTLNKTLSKDTQYKILNTITTVNGYSSTVEYDIYECGGLPQKFDIAITPSQDFDAINNGYVLLTIESKEQKGNAGKFILERSSDSGQSWNKMAEFSLTNTSPKYEWKDNSVESGVEYKYSVIQYGSYQENEDIYYSERLVSQPIVAYFNDMFLSDGEKQLKILYNPKVSSFKENILEQKIDTIGGKYPFFFRNGNTRYKEIPISGLISYHMDENEMFIDKRSVGIQNETINLTNENFYQEKQFKLEVLKWLNNGKPKLFRSPAEGNYVIRLMNTSLSPNDQLGRMLHTFSSTGYECADFDLHTLLTKDLIRFEQKNSENYDSNFDLYVEMINSSYDNNEIYFSAEDDIEFTAPVYKIYSLEITPVPSAITSDEDIKLVLQKDDKAQTLFISEKTTLTDLPAEVNITKGRGLEVLIYARLHKENSSSQLNNFLLNYSKLNGGG